MEIRREAKNTSETIRKPSVTYRDKEDSGRDNLFIITLMGFHDRNKVI